MRITKAHLEAKVSIINDTLGTNPKAWNVIGTVQLYSAYGATGVHRVMNTVGGVDDLMGGLGASREVSRFLDGIIAGLRLNTER